MSVFQLRNFSGILLINSEKFYFLDIFLETCFKDRIETQSM